MGLSRHTVRLAGAAAAAIMAGIYYLIGIGVLDAGGTTSGVANDQLGFGFSAGTAFLATAALLLLTDRRWLWVLATLFQVLVVVIYIGASTIRDPAFEVWGITLRIVQIPLVLALGYLALTVRDRDVDARGVGARPAGTHRAGAGRAG